MLANACCCDPSCLIDSDDFDRANSNDIGGKWTDANARIVDNRLAQQTLGSMLVMTTKNHISETMVVDVAITFTASSISLDKGIVIVNAKDSNNYLFVQIEVSNSAFSGTAISTKLKFYRRSGGVNTQLGSTRTISASTAVNSQQVRVCYDGTYLKSMGYREVATKITDGFKAGLAAEGSATIYFNNFEWSKLSDKCPSCTVLVECGNCIVQPKDTFIVDFGAGGLIDGSCNGCDTLVGEYVLEYIPRLDPYSPKLCTINNLLHYGCQWGYRAFLCPYILTDTHELCIQAYLTQEFFPAGTSMYVMIGIVPKNAAIGAVHTAYTAQYKAWFSDLATCDESPLTLTKLFETFVVAGVCTGSLPATIEVRQVA